MNTYYALKTAPKGHTTQMRNGRFTASLERARRLKDIGRAHGLPAGTPVPVYPIDALPGAPESWVREPGCYVCPVESGWGLWFDWTNNDKLNTAILPSVKGMNPITGQKLDDLSLHQYKERCPVHDMPFKGDERLCEECGYKWPPQSYVASPNVLWWDGFRTPDGKVRQFFFSEEEIRDVASAVIGKENTVPAFGFAFFEPKKRREPPPRSRITRSLGFSPHSFGGYQGGLTKKGLIGTSTSWKGGYGTSMGYSANVDVNNELQNFVYAAACSAPAPTEHGLVADQEELCGNIEFPLDIHTDSLEAVKKDVAVGAGAEINQDLSPDPLAPTDWKEEPSAIIRLYFVFEPEFNDIVKRGGIKNLDGDPEGFLKGIPVG